MVFLKSQAAQKFLSRKCILPQTIKANHISLVKELLRKMMDEFEKVKYQLANYLGPYPTSVRDDEYKPWGYKGHKSYTLLVEEDRTTRLGVLCVSLPQSMYIIVI